MPDVTLISISRNKAYLRNAGQLEYLPLTRGPAPLPERLAADTEIGMEPESDADELSGAVEGFVSPDPDIVVTLSRERVQQALSVSDLAQVELEVIAVGQAAEQLVRVSNLESGGIYQLLDLRKGDVLMEVNGEPIRGGADLLLQALENETLVDLAILREDLVPRRLIYDLE
jgi:C-terminal processing protease CtpA/Prc